MIFFALKNIAVPLSQSLNLPHLDEVEEFPPAAIPAAGWLDMAADAVFGAMLASNKSDNFPTHPPKPHTVVVVSRAGEIERELMRAIDAITKAGIDPRTLRGRIKELEDERENVAQEFSAMSEVNPVALHPTAIAKYRDSVARLAQLLFGLSAANAPELSEAVRSLVSTVVVRAKPNTTELEVEVKGRLGRSGYRNKRPPTGGVCW